MAVDENQKAPTTTTAIATATPAATQHVLMVVLSAQGHMNPFLRLGKRLHSKGLYVTLATTDTARQRRVLNRSSDPVIPGIHLEYFSDGTRTEGDRSNMEKYFECINRFGPVNLTDLIRELDNRPIPKISCIIDNPFIPWVADVAAQLSIPSAMLWIQPCSILSLYYRFYNKINPFHNNDVLMEDQILTVDIAGLPTFHTVDLPSFILPSNTMKFISEALSKCLRSTHKYRWILANSFDELEAESIESISGFIPVRSVGPLVSWTLLSDLDESEEDSGNLDMWKADESCMEWLTEQAPCSVVYVSFGSLLSLSNDIMESITIALKRTKRPFLWVVKVPEVGIKGEVQVMADFVEETREQGRVVSWCPQNRVLKHPAIGCFLTHCGWNSVLEAVTAGVPLVCHPQWTDQPINAKLVVDVFRVGVRVWPDKSGGISAEEIEKCIEDVMVGPDAKQMRARATEWRWAAREAVAEGGSSDRNIQWFVDEIVKLSSGSCNV